VSRSQRRQGQQGCICKLERAGNQCAAERHIRRGVASCSALARVMQRGVWQRGCVGVGSGPCPGRGQADDLVPGPGQIPAMFREIPAIFSSGLCAAEGCGCVSFGGCPSGCSNTALRPCPFAYSPLLRQCPAVPAGDPTGGVHLLTSEAAPDKGLLP